MSALALPSTGLGGTGWEPCSDRSRQRDDPLWATAGRGLRWFLVELSSGWGPRALLDPPFDPQLGSALVSRVERAGMRPLAIRRPGRRDGTPRWRWAVVDARPGTESVRWGEVDAPSELLDVPLDGSSGAASDRPIFAVCAHGRHDRCCAVRGRRAAQDLAAAFPEETWECSHLGGDRFAATMVLFPHGLAYGRIDDADVTAIAQRYLDGRVAEPWFRGRTSLSHPVQAAQHFARLESGDDRLDSFAPLAEGAGAHDRDVGHHVVELADADGGRVVVELAETLSAPLLSTCGTTRPGRVREWALTSLRRLPA